MRLAISHRTRYEFDEPVIHALQRLRLTPKTTGGQRIVEWALRLEGAQRELEYEDHNNNTTTLVSVEPGVTGVEIVCEGIVETGDQAGVIGRHAGHLPLWHFTQQSPLTRPGPAMKALLAGLDQGADRLAALHALSARILGAVGYETGRTDSDTTGEQAVEAGRGVCQDHSHVFLGCARQMGIPARYVSGYLMMSDRIEQEAGHAWAEAFVQGLGWVGFDVANGISPDARYVRVATGRDYQAAAPITGISTGGSGHHLSVALEISQRAVEQ